MADDFRSLLSTFQAATSTEEENQEKKDHDGRNKESLSQLTTKLWRVTQVRQCTKKSSEAEGKQETAAQKIHFAICLCVVDKLPHEEIWRYWMNTAGKDDEVSAELYIHAKHPERINSPWAKSKLISTSYRPNWNDVRIVRAMLKLAETALLQERTTHVVFGTESCIPICSLKKAQSEIVPGTSYIKCYGYRESTRFDEHNIWNVLQHCIPRDAVHKALPGWSCLSRSHIQAILNLPSKHLQNQPLWPAFENVWAPEEIYFPTCLALLGLLGGAVTNRSLTYAEWDHAAKIHKNRAHPRFFDADFGANLVQSLLQREKSLFLRKIKDRMPLRRWQEAVGLGVDSSAGREQVAGSKRKALHDDVRGPTRSGELRHQRRDDYYGRGHR